ncbi:hypothetical protein Psch_01231 [Pelotomaculum schinkii]|uniref:DUF1287 domain-containing protein n=1 Tax=Pelotomaculum schinkii TaxID=78350 RepID=A0A4Y7RFV3_9FIRM|nr:DUF1287 domain-containing protein [Pelotomaculum schinkii]TEB07676.1 hypothetical protein Psch_01231 [Pelotomaculum schinkii]
MNKIKLLKTYETRIAKEGKTWLWVVKSLLLIVAAALLFGLFEWRYHYFNLPRLDPQGLVEQRCVVEKVVLDSDKDGDGIYDLDDIVQGARKDLEARPLYKDAYYAGGYPPENEGVCTDVIWRALQNAGYDLKRMMDRDIQAHPDDYPRVAGTPEPNIDFRRVPNQEAFFKKYAEQLTTEIKPWDAENLKQWQGGDIVVFGPPNDHVGVVSDKRQADGVPFLIHNAGPSTREDNGLLSWPSTLKYHFRYPKAN